MMNSLIKTDEMEVDDPNSVIICRLCAEVTSPKSFIPLYTDDKQEQPVVKQINRLVSNLISPNDGLPQDVCLRCAENVGKFYAFVASIIETQNKLRRIMQLPEIKEIGSGEESQHISFLNDNTSPYALTHADGGPEILASRDTNIRLNGNSKFSPSKGNKAKTEDRTLGNADPSKNRFLMKRIPDSDAASNVHPLSRPIRLYRCGACDARFQSSEECIRHIAQTHKDMRKEASPNTIFVSLPAPANHDDSSGSFETSQEPRPSASSSLRFSTSANKAFSSFKPTTASTSTKQLNEVVGSTSNNPVQPPKQSVSSTSTPNHLSQTSTSVTKSAASSRPAPQTPCATASQQSAKTSAAAPATTEPKDEVKRTRHRKVLAIDGFFKEVTKKVTRYICDVCGRSMTSQFAFIRHLHEHDWSDDEMEEYEKSKRKSLPPVPRPKPGYCSPCKIRVPNSVRHKMFHAISNLEKAHPNHVHLLAVA